MPSDARLPRLSTVVLRCALLLLTATVATFVAAGCAKTPAPSGSPANQVSQLEQTDLVVGQGAEATNGARVTVHYTGWLYDAAAPEHKGRQFDSSRAGQAFSFDLGQGQVIAGWDQGVAGMKVGGQRRLVIPAALGYGDRGAGGVIPPGATLLFEIELLGVQAAE